MLIVGSITQSVKGLSLTVLLYRAGAWATHISNCALAGRIKLTDRANLLELLYHSFRTQGCMNLAAFAASVMPVVEASGISSLIFIPRPWPIQLLAEVHLSATIVTPRNKPGLCRANLPLDGIGFRYLPELC